MERDEGEIGSGEVRGRGDRLPVVRLPLNSKRLKAGHIKRLATALDLPTAASAEELRQIIDGQLAEEGRETQNIQVVLSGADPSAEFSLEDEGGRFLTVPQREEEEEVHEEPQGPGEEEEGQGLGDLRQELEALAEENEALKAEVRGLERKLSEEKARFRNLWRTNCQCLAEYDEVIVAKDSEIEELKRQLSSHTGGDQPSRETPAITAPGIPMRASSEVQAGGESPTRQEPSHSVGSRKRRGKAPPVDPFTGEDVETRLDEWIPSLERACVWNDWTEEELLLQLAGHLRGRALQEWGLLDSDTKKSYTQAVEALRLRLDPGSRTLAAQDFRHTAQNDDERVADFIRRLERTFNVAYGREGMSTETRDTLLHGQLQDGLKHELMKAAAVSGAQSYKALCLAARNEEKRLAELKKRQQYLKPSVAPPRPLKKLAENKPFVPTESKPGYPKATSPDTRKCFLCQKPGHLARECRARPTERGGQSNLRKTPVVTKKVTANPQAAEQGHFESLQECLYSSDEDTATATVSMVRVADKGSKSQCVQVQVQGVPAYGVLDSGADITIMGGALFRKVATVARLKKRDLKRPDKTPRNYDQTPFTLDGRMDLDITFEDRTMCTPVYIKTDAHEQLLLSEGVCRQLGILQYHSSIEPWRGGRKTQARTSGRSHPEKNTRDVSKETTPTDDRHQPAEQAVEVPTVRVNLVQSLNLLPHQGATVSVSLGPGSRLPESEPVLLEPSTCESFVHVDDSVLQFDREGLAQVAIFNSTGCSCSVEAGMELGEASVVTLIPPDSFPTEEARDPSSEDSTLAVVNRVTESEVTQRKQMLCELVGTPELLTPTQTEELHQFLGEQHEAFCLEPNERGETDILTMEIDTGDARPKKQPARRMPYDLKSPSNCKVCRRQG